MASVDSKPPKSLQDLPMEIMMEITAALNLGDILALRQVSCRMNTMTHLRSIWERLLSERGASTLLRKRLDLHTSAELERTVIDQAKGEHAVKSGGEWKRSRGITLNDPCIEDAHLIPGGRWLLNIPRDCAYGVLYADLDAPEPSWRQLIPPDPTVVRHCASCIEHVQHAPDFTLHLAIACTRRLFHPESHAQSPEGNNPSGVHEVAIWSISQEFDDQGVISGLQAQRLSQFIHSPETAGFVTSIKLQADNVVLVQGNPSYSCSVIKWAMVDGLTENVPCKVVRHLSCDFAQLLSTDILLVGGLDTYWITIWELASIPTSFSDRGPNVSRSPRWTKQTYGVLPCWPPPQVINGEIYQILPLSRGMCLLTFLPSSPISFSRDSLTYSASPSNVGETPPLYICRTNAFNRHLNLPMQRFTIPFGGYRTYFDAFSSNVIFNDFHSSIHIGTLVVAPEDISS